MRQYKCEFCHHDTEAADDCNHMYIDCPECGKRSGCKLMDNPLGNGKNILKFAREGHNTYSEIRFRPRGI